jgi:hypothetical protein
MKSEVHVTRGGDGTRQTLNAASTSTTNINDPQVALDTVPAEYCKMKRRLAEVMWILEPGSALMNHKRYEAPAHLC